MPAFPVHLLQVLQSSVITQKQTGRGQSPQPWEVCRGTKGGADAVQCYWFCFRTVMRSQSHWSCFCFPLAQRAPCGSQEGRAATRAAWRSFTAGSGARSVTMAGRSWTRRWFAGSWDLSKIPWYWLTLWLHHDDKESHEPHRDPILRVCFLILVECFKGTTKLKSITDCFPQSHSSI